jgi:ABC-type sugar transport system ATPase subunit
MENRQEIEDFILTSTNVSKRFGGVQALDSVSFNLRRGEVHALVGENGAGKSTYIKILCGLYRKDEGEIHYCGNEYFCEDTLEARKQGIGLVPQLIHLAEQLTVAENIFMGIYPVKAKGLVDWKLLYEKAWEIAKIFSMQHLVREPVYRLGTGHRQMVEILKALVFDTKIIAFDEPTASLSEDESKALFRLIGDLKEKGISIIYVSHRLEELFQIADRMTVFKDGKYIGTREIKDVTKDQIVSMMVGREFDMFGEDFRKHKPTDETIMEVRDLTLPGKLKDINFNLKKHEILGFYGMVGSGRTETAMTLFGAYDKGHSKITLNGKEAHIKSPKDAVSHNIGLVPENRISEGVILRAPVKNNITLPFVRRLQKSFLLQHRKEKTISRRYIDILRIKTPGEETVTRDLSGGNQQKVSIAKWLAAESEVVIFDEPTHGIDVGAKHDIYQLLRELSDEGKGVIIISSELPEILQVCDRILIFRDGKITKELINTKELKEEDVVAYALG